MRYFFICLIMSSMAFGQETKITPPSAEKACKLFGEVQDKLNERQSGRNKTAIAVAGAALGTLAFVEGARYLEVRNNRKTSQALNDLRKSFDIEVFPDPHMTNSIKKEIEYRTLKKGLKKLVAATGIGTAVAFGAEVVIEGSITSALKSVADDFAAPLGDSTMTAHYAKHPEKFIELSKIEACAHLGADKESQSAPFLRQSVLEMHELLVNNQKETPEVAQDESDAAINSKSDLSTRSPVKESKKSSAKAE